LTTSSPTSTTTGNYCLRNLYGAGGSVSAPASGGKAGALIGEISNNISNPILQNSVFFSWTFFDPTVGASKGTPNYSESRGLRTTSEMQSSGNYLDANNSERGWKTSIWNLPGGSAYPTLVGLPTP